MNMLRIKGIWAGTVLMVIFVLAGCGSAEHKADTGKNQKAVEGYQTIVNHYAGIILQQDKDSAMYGQALEQVGIYLKKLDKKSLKTARNQVQSAVQEMEQADRLILPCRLKKEFVELLAENGINYEEYVASADKRSENLHDYITTLKSLDEYLGYEEIDDLTREELQYVYEMSVKQQEIMKKYNYYDINYWFAGWEKEKTAYVKQEVLDRLTSFAAEGAVWENSRKTVEQHMERCLNQFDELNGEWAEHIGEYQEKVYKQIEEWEQQK